MTLPPNSHEPKRVAFRIDFHGGAHVAVDYIDKEVLHELFVDTETSLCEWLNMICDHFDEEHPQPDGWQEYVPAMSIDVYESTENGSYRISMVPVPEMNLDDMLNAISVAVVGLYTEKRNEFTPEEFYTLIDHKIRNNLLQAREMSDDPNVIDFPHGARFQMVEWPGPGATPWWRRLVQWIKRRWPWSR